MSSVTAVKIWIWLSVYASAAGWILSALGWLGPAGYVVLGGVTLALWFGLNRGNRSGPKIPCWNLRKLRRRFVRPFPLLFALLAGLVLLGGLLYAPSNHTGLSYRIPRVLHWLAAEQWHWIDAPNYRMNNRACGIEWMSAPLLLFFKTDRLLFLLNYIPFLLLPGQLFSLLRRLGVRGRVAWSWMWIFPTGYVFLLQAGSAGNDAFPMVYAIAAVDFAGRAWQTRRASDLWYATLALALLTGAKASNLPLGLMWFIAIVPLWRVIKSHLLAASLIAALALLVSFVPTAALNVAHCGSWSGLQLEKQGIEMKNPFVGLWGNGFVLAINNLCPPFFPFAKWWNEHGLDQFPAWLIDPLKRNFEWPFQEVLELPTEDWAGIGPGLSVLMLLALVYALPFYFRRDPARWNQTVLPPLVLKLVLLAPWIAFAAYCMKSGMVTPGRLIAPYYPLLLPSLLLGAAQVQLVRQRWWRWLVSAIFLVALVVLVVTPPRPLWPAQTILKQLAERRPASRLVNRALISYTVYRVRPDPLAAVRAQLPAEVKTIGYLGTVDDLDISLWKPYGSGRRVVHLYLKDSAEQIRARHVHYAVVSGFHLAEEKASLEEWLLRARAEIVADVTAIVTVRMGEQHWYIVRFKD
jgi:hypothetical protein